MNERIKNHVEEMFSSAPRSRKAFELKDELAANLNDRYNDLLSQGMDEETAFKTALAGIGDIDELIRGLREQEVFDPVQIQMQRQKSALLISVAVAIYIISFIFPVIFGWLGGFGHVTGVVLMFICWAAATMLIVYNALSKPKYVKAEDTIVEEFKEWKVSKVKKNSVFKALTSMIWTITVLLYLVIGLFFNAWHPGWLLFVLAPVVTQIIRLVSIYSEDDPR